MHILYSYFYQIGYEQNEIIPRQITSDMNRYILELVSFVTNNQATRLFKTRSDDTEVIGITTEIMNSIYSWEVEDINGEQPENSRDQYMSTKIENIARRLLRSEIDRQALIDRLGTRIRKGSLLAVCLKDEEEDKYIFMLSKVNNTNFIDDIELNFRAGFSSDSQKEWKSTLIECVKQDDEGIQIDTIKVYLNSAASYWCDEFLEIDEMHTDEVNTGLVHKSVEATLVKMIKPSAPSDYLHLSNYVIGYMRRGGILEYPRMIDDIFREYEPIELSHEQLEKTIDKLCELPEKKKFDCQFTCIPSQIKARVKKLYKVTESIELKINGYMDQIEDTIQSFEDEDGERFIQIKTTDNNTYRTFKRRE